MLTAISVSGLVKFAIGLLGAGLVSGFMAGLFGIGGGGILVPVLYEVFGAMGVASDVRMQLAVGTSMAVIIPTTLRTSAAHRARGTVDAHVVKAMAAPCVAGVVLGILTASHVGSGGVRLAWAIFAGLMSMRMLLPVGRWRLGDHVPGQPVIGLYAAAVGFISAIMSIAGGLYVTLLLVLYGRPIHQAIATGTGVGPYISIAGTLGYFWAGWGAMGTPPGSIGYVNVPMAAVVAVTSILVAPHGIKIAYRLRPRYLEIGFGLFLVSASIRFLVSLL